MKRYFNSRSAFAVFVFGLDLCALWNLTSISTSALEFCIFGLVASLKFPLIYSRRFWGIRSPLFLLIFCYTSFSLSYYPFFYYLLGSIELRGYDEYTMHLVSQLGQLLQLVTVLFFWSAFPSRKSSQSINPISWKSTKSQLEVYFLFIIAFGLSYISMLLGLSKMGAETATVLPFGIAGIINVARIAIIPIFACWHIVIKRKPRIQNFMIFLAWLLFESYVRSSRGAVLNGLLPMLIAWVYMYGISRKLITAAFGVALLSAALYPVITYVRYDQSIGDVISGSSTLDIDLDSFSPYKRLFLTGHVISVYSFENRNSLCCGEPLAKVFGEYGSLAKYFTYNVDGFSVDAIHSSGMTFQAEGIILFGLGGILIYQIALLQFAKYVDRAKFSGMQKTIFFIFIYQLLQVGFIEAFQSQFQYIFALLASGIYLALVEKKMRKRMLYKNVQNSDGSFSLALPR